MYLKNNYVPYLHLLRFISVDIAKRLRYNILLFPYKASFQFIQFGDKGRSFAIFHDKVKLLYVAALRPHTIKPNISSFLSYVLRGKLNKTLKTYRITKTLTKIICLGNICDNIK